MASIRIKQPKQTGAARSQTGASASRLTPGSQKKRQTKRLSAPSQPPAPAPDIPNPLAELPPEGSATPSLREMSSNEKKGLGAEKKSGPGDGRDSIGKGPAVTHDVSRRHGGGRRNASG